MSMQILNLVAYSFVGSSTLHATIQRDGRSSGAGHRLRNPTQSLTTSCRCHPRNALRSTISSSLCRLVVLLPRSKFTLPFRRPSTPFPSLRSLTRVPLHLLLGNSHSVRQARMCSSYPRVHHPRSQRTARTKDDHHPRVPEAVHRPRLPRLRWSRHLDLPVPRVRCIFVARRPVTDFWSPFAASGPLRATARPTCSSTSPSARSLEVYRSPVPVDWALPSSLRSEATISLSIGSSTFCWDS